MISKNDFCCLLKDCRNIESYIDKLKGVKLSFEDDHPCYSLVSHIIDFLDKQFKGDWVGYYFYERECNGTELNHKPTPFLWEEDGTEIWIHSDEELYDYLLENYSGE